MKTVDVHIFSPGTQTSAQGVTREFTKSDLQQVVKSYTPGVHEAPLRVGHEDNDKQPAWGWVKGVKMKGEHLYAEVEFSPQMAQFVKDGLYRKVSASFYAPESKINPEPGNWSLRHVAMLGAQPPAVKGLKGWAYTESDEQTFDFAAATGQVKLSPEQVFDEELGPTIKSEQSPLEYLKNEIEEARTEMAAEAKEKAEAQATLDEMDMDTGSEEQETEFAEEEKSMKKMKKKAPANEQGAEDAEEEVDGEDTTDNGECGSRKKKGASYKEDEAESEDTMDNKEKMDPVGKEDKDVDNDGDSNETDEYLKKRRAAISKSTKGDTSDNSEITVPEGVDAAQWEAGFKDAVDKFYAAAEAGDDEVVHNETEDQTADYLAGVEAGFEFGQARMSRIGSDGIGSASHDDKCCDDDEVVDGEGPVASKTKKNAKHGANETDVEAGNNFKEGKKGKDGLKSADDEEDEVANAENDFGRDKTGKTKESDSANRKKKGVADKGAGPMMRDTDYDAKGSDGGAQEKDRASKGTGSVPKQDGGKTKDVQAVKETTYKPLGGASGGGKQVKSPAVSVKYISHSEGPDFSELTERLAALEAANARLVQEKIAAERAAHRLQLEDFAESLYASGRLTDAVVEQDELVDYMEGLEHGTLEFAEGESAATKLMELLASLPAQVTYSEVVSHNPEEVPLEDLNPHEKALRLSKEEGIDYAEALKQTLFTVD